MQPRVVRDGQGTPRAAAFSIAFNDPAARPKPKAKPSGSFRFLRKDEGQRAHPVNVPSDRSHSAPRTRNESASLRAAIAADMRRRQGDPFATADVAVPKRAPPSHDESESKSESRERELERSHQGDEVRETAAERPAKGSLRERLEAVANRPGADDDDHESFDGGHDAESAHQERFKPNARDAARLATRKEAPPNAVQRSTDVLDADTDDHQGGRAGPVRLTAGRHQLLKTHLRPREEAREEFEPDEVWQPPRRGPASGVAHQPAAHRRENLFRREVEEEAASNDSLERQLVAELEEERKACAAEKKHYLRLKLQLEKERQRFESYKDEVELQLEAEREDMLRLVEEEKRALKKQQRTVEEQRRAATTSASADRETMKRLQFENTQLTEQLEHALSEQREAEKQAKAEIARLKRDIASLTTRNAELLEMVRSQQVAAMSHAAPSRGSSAGSDDGADMRRPPRYDTDETYHGERSEASEADFGETRAKVGRGSKAVEETERESKLRAAREKRAKAIEERMLQEERERAERLQREQEKIVRRRAATAAAEAPVDQTQSQPAQQFSATLRPGQIAAAQQAVAAPPPPPSATIETVSKPSSKRLPPTADELIADTEPDPIEDFPGDIIIAKSDANENGKREHLFKSGKREVFYSNGTKKVILKSGVVTLYFSNGDIKRTFPSGKSTYNYAASQTIHTTLANGDQIFQFLGENQTERHHPDGTKEILYPDGIYKVIFPNQSEEIVYPDGTVQYGNGDQD